MGSFFSRIAIAALSFAVPLTALAARPRTLGDIINTGTEVSLLFVPSAMLLLIFVWSMGQVIAASGGDAEKKKAARNRIVWGLIAMFTVFSLAGLVAVLQNTLFNNVPLTAPSTF